MRYSKSIYKIHSPFLYDLVAHVLESKSHIDSVEKIEKLRNDLSSSTEKIVFEGFGATVAAKTHPLNYVVKHISTPHRYGTWYYKVIEKFNYKQIVELGTCIGIGTMYLASNPQTNVVTFEANKACVDKAKELFELHSLANIEIIEGDIQDTLASYVIKAESIDMVLIDANHTYEATLHYFNQLMPKIHSKSLVVIDDIYWSEEMTRAWESLKNHPAVCLSLDFYRAGFLFFEHNRLEKEHFKVWVND
ncbi:MAG: class I SAM-dependent methyltransferase [Bacteroidota bacterium]